jgi:hypothetical protein
MIYMKIFTYVVLSLKVCCHFSLVYVFCLTKITLKAIKHRPHQATVKITKLSPLSNQCWIFTAYRTFRIQVDADKDSFKNLFKLYLLAWFLQFYVYFVYSKIYNIWHLRDQRFVGYCNFLDIRILLIILFVYRRWSKIHYHTLLLICCSFRHAEVYYICLFCLYC